MTERQLTSHFLWEYVICSHNLETRDVTRRQNEQQIELRFPELYTDELLCMNDDVSNADKYQQLPRDLQIWEA